MRNVSKDGSLRAQAIELGRLLLDIGRKRGLRDPLSSSIEAEFTPAQIHSILWLGFDGPLTMGELARRCGITEKTITGIVDRMERLGLFQRVRDLVDRRVVRVQLLPGGERAFRTVRDGMLAKLSAMLEMLDPDDRKGILRIFEKLRDRAAEAEAEAGDKVRPGTGAAANGGRKAEGT
jgi:DNA-binding MarR family transcriptional regulator